MSRAARLPNAAVSPLAAALIAGTLAIIRRRDA
jgi:hypothetical protein